MLPNISQDIRDMITVYPREIKISSVRTRKICVQDILSQKNIDLNKIAGVYEPPKLIDIIKQGMAAMVDEDINRMISDKYSGGDNFIVGADNMIKNIIMPTEVNIPVGAGNRYPNFNYVTYGGASAYAGEDFMNSVHSFSSQIAEMFHKYMNYIYSTARAITSNIEVNRDAMKIGDKYVVDTLTLVGKSMSKSLADYFRNMLINVVKNGCSYFPSGISGVLSLEIINNTMFPQTAIFDNVVVRSMGYLLSRANGFTVMMAPTESDMVKVPIEIYNVDAIDYVLSHRGKGGIPVTFQAKVMVGPKSKNMEYEGYNVVVM